LCGALERGFISPFGFFLPATHGGIMAKTKLHGPEQVAAFLAEVNSQTDRGAAIVSAGVLDELLELAILARLIKISSDRHESLFKRTGAPLSSFSAKIEMSFALGIISNDARLALHLVRDIRNIFAHRIEQITFDHAEVRTMIDARATSSVKAMAVSYKQKFINNFQGIAFVLYGTLAADIRIKSLEETHQGHFLNVIMEAARISQAASPAQPPETERG
jgi:hypothetical protein